MLLRYYVYVLRSTSLIYSTNIQYYVTFICVLVWIIFDQTRQQYDYTVYNTVSDIVTLQFRSMDSEMF